MSKEEAGAKDAGGGAAPFAASDFAAEAKALKHTDVQAHETSKAEVAEISEAEQRMGKSAH